MDWQSINRFILTYLDPIGIVLGLLMFIPVVWAWWTLTFGRERQRRKWHRELSRRPGQRPGILIVDLLPQKNIRPMVDNFRLRREGLKIIPEDRIFTLSRDEWLNPDHMPQLQDDLRAIAADIYAAGIDTLHCFHAGPAVSAALIGREFANACRVVLYQYHQGDYVNYGVLNLPE